MNDDKLMQAAAQLATEIQPERDLVGGYRRGHRRAGTQALDAGACAGGCRCFAGRSVVRGDLHDDEGARVSPSCYCIAGHGF